MDEKREIKDGGKLIRVERDDYVQEYYRVHINDNHWIPRKYRKKEFGFFIPKWGKPEVCKCDGGNWCGKREYISLCVFNMLTLNELRDWGLKFPLNICSSTAINLQRLGVEDD